MPNRAKPLSSSISPKPCPCKSSSDADSLSPISPISQPTQSISRWAALVAEGAVAFPSGLTAEESEQLRADVSRRRRERLVKFLARVIAADIRSSREARHGGGEC